MDKRAASRSEHFYLGTAFILIPFPIIGRDILVCIATRYELDGLASNPSGTTFSAPIETGPGPTQSPVEWALGPFPGSTETGAWR